MQALSKLIEAMLVRIHSLVHDEHRPFSYLDFMRFEINGQEYHMTHGTFRNNISWLIRKGLVEVSYKSSITFYTLRDIKLSKLYETAMTGNGGSTLLFISISIDFVPFL